MTIVQKLIHVLNYYFLLELVFIPILGIINLILSVQQSENVLELLVLIR
jgi:hypothetical protein